MYITGRQIKLTLGKQIAETESRIRAISGKRCSGMIKAELSADALTHYRALLALQRYVNSEFTDNHELQWTD